MHEDATSEIIFDLVKHIGKATAPGWISSYGQYTIHLWVWHVIEIETNGRIVHYFDSNSKPHFNETEIAYLADPNYTEKVVSFMAKLFVENQ